MLCVNFKNNVFPFYLFSFCSFQETHNGSSHDSYPLPSPRPRITISSPANSASANDTETTDNVGEGEEEEVEEAEEKEEEESQAGFEDDNLYQVPPSNQPIKKPPDGVLYSVSYVCAPFFVCSFF